MTDVLENKISAMMADNAAIKLQNISLDKEH
jgi:hypothetical protein